MNKPPSLIKWTGSKRSQAHQIASLFPDNRNATYFEPFLGGGSMLFFGADWFSHAVASDVYAPLIDLWQSIKEVPQKVIQNYEAEWWMLQKNFPAHFSAVRKRFNESPNGQDLLFLSRTCANGIIRFNREGEFNNSIHLSRRGMRPATFAEIVRKWSGRLRNVEFATQDYAEVLKLAKDGDFIYLDPPYANSHNRYIEDLNVGRLIDFLRALNEKRVLWALSFDGERGGFDMTYALPSNLYAFHTELASGHSAVQKVLNSKVEEVRESLYLNYRPPKSTLFAE